MKKLLAMLLICAMALGMSGIASAETNDLSLMPGTTVIEDASSPTGYTVTFTFESAEAGSVQLDVGANYYAKPNYEAVGVTSSCSAHSLKPSFPPMSGRRI